MWVCLANACVFLFVSAGSAVDTITFLVRSVHAEGTITALAKSVADDGTINYRPVFTFVTTDGKRQTVQSYVGSAPPDFEVGDTVPVRYKPADPSVARIDTFWQTWALATMFAIGACAMVLFGWFFRWRVQKKLNALVKLKRIQSLDVV
jgi:hypothetical protein